MESLSENFLKQVRDRDLSALSFEPEIYGKHVKISDFIKNLHSMTAIAVEYYGSNYKAEKQKAEKLIADLQLPLRAEKTNKLITQYQNDPVLKKTHPLFSVFVFRSLLDDARGWIAREVTSDMQETFSEALDRCELFFEACRAGAHHRALTNGFGNPEKQTRHYNDAREKLDRMCEKVAIPAESFYEMHYRIVHNEIPLEPNPIDDLIGWAQDIKASLNRPQAIQATPATRHVL